MQADEVPALGEHNHVKLTVDSSPDGHHDAFWGSRYAIIEDPGGIAVGLMSPADPVFQSRPPEV